MALTNEQRKRNIERALSRVRQSTGGVTGYISGASVKGYSGSSGGGGSGTGGTQIVVDSATGRSAIVKTTKENLVAIEKGRQAELRRRAGTKVTTPQEIRASLLKRQGYNVSVSKEGTVTATKGDRKTVITRSGKTAIVPKGAKVSVVDLSASRRLLQQRKQTQQQVQQKKEAQQTPQEKRTFLQKLDRIRRAPVEGFTKLIQGDIEVRSTIKQYANSRGGFNKLTKKERGAAVASAYLGALGRLGRGVLSVYLTPDDVAKGIVMLVMHPIKTGGAIYDEFRRDPVGTTIELWAAKKAIDFAGAKVLNTKLAKSFKNSAKKVARNLGKIREKVPGAKRIASAEREINAAVKKPSVIRRAVNRYNKIVSKIKTGKGAKLPKGTRENLAREYIRKVETNERAIKQYEQIKNTTFKELKRSNLSKSAREVQLRPLKVKIRSLKKTNIELNKSLKRVKISPQKRAIIRRNVVRELKGKKVPISRGKLRVKASVRLKASARSKIDYAKKFVKEPTRRVITQMRDTLQRHGYTIRVRAGKVIRALTKPAKRALGKAKSIIETTGKLTKSVLNKVRRVLLKYNLEIRRITRAGLRKAKEPVTKTINAVRRGNRRVVRTIRSGKNSVRVYLKGTENVISRKLTESLNALNRKLPVSIKLKIVTRSGKVKSWPLKSRIIKFKVKNKVYNLRTITTKDFLRLSSKVRKIIRKELAKRSFKDLPARTRRLLRKKFKAEAKTPKSIKRFREAQKELLRKAKKNKIIKEELTYLIRKDKNFNDFLRGTADTNKLIADIRHGKFINVLARGVRKGKINYYRLSPNLRKLVRIKMLNMFGKNATKRILGRSRKEGNIKTNLSESKFLIKERLLINKLRRQKAVADIGKAQSEANKAYREVVTEQGQVLLQEMKQPVTTKKASKIKAEIDKVKKARSKTVAKKAYKEAASDIRDGQQAVLKLVRRARTTPKVARLAIKSTAVLASLSKKLKTAASRQNLRPGVSPGVTPRSTPASKPKQQAKTKPAQKVVQVPKETPSQRIDTKPKSKQAQIITAIIASLATAQAFRIGGRRILKSQTRLRGGVSKLRRYILDRLSSKRKVYTPDIYSLIFGIRAKPGQRITLLKPGRVFTGLERRAIVR